MAEGKNNANVPSTTVSSVELLNVTSLAGHTNPAYVVDTQNELQKLHHVPEKRELPNDVSHVNTNTRKRFDWRATIKRRIYILSWIKLYNKNTAISDMIAGITLGLTIIPQAIAYAALAGLPSQYGLYSAFVGSLVYIVFGTIKQVSIGPTSLMALLTLRYTIDKPPEFAVILAFLAGCVELVMGIFNLEIESNEEVISFKTRHLMQRRKSGFEGLPKWRALLERRIYILHWIKIYDKESVISDMIAGLTLGLTIIPQAIAYAALAGLPSQYGLYSAFIGSITYVFFGTIKQVSIGPTALMSLLTLQYTMDKPPEYAMALAFLVGIVELLMGVLNLGFIVSFISEPVTNAFTSATSLIVVGSQLKNIFGIKYSSKGFVDSIYELFARIGDIRLGDSLLGVSCCIILLAFKLLTSIPINFKSNGGRLLKRSLWYLSISRNAVVVIASSFLAYTLHQEQPLFKLSGNVVPGVPSFHFPNFHIEHNNHTTTFLEVCRDLGSGIVILPVVAVLANIAIAKAFSTGSLIDASQEMLVLGMCNIFGSCFKSMPTCGAFSRSAVSNASGVKTPMAGLYSGGLTVLALSFLTPYFYFIPKASLAAVLIVAVVFLVDVELPGKLWRRDRTEFFAWLGTFIVCLAIGVELGLLFGILANVIYLLYLWARPKLDIELNDVHGIEYILVRPHLGLFFPCMDYIRENINKFAAECDYSKPIVLDCYKFTGIDYTAAEGINLIAKDLSKLQESLIIRNLDEGLQNFIAVKNIFVCNKNDDLRAILRAAKRRDSIVPAIIEPEDEIDEGKKL